MHPEYKADFGKDRSVKPVDWAFYQNGRPIFLVEAKDAGKKLAGYDEQLGDYFAKVPDVKLGILTNGITWRFFTDIINANVMDKEPFVKWDLLSDEKPPLDFLTILQKSEFNPQLIRTFAERRRNQNLLLNEISRLLEPSSEFVRLAITNIETRNLTEKVVETWKPVLASALEEWVKQKMLAMALDPTKLPQMAADASARIETTQEELDGFATVQRLLGPDRPVAYEDTISYFKIHLKERYPWVMCRLYFSKKRPMVWVPLAIEEAQTLAKQFSVMSPQAGWSCLTLESNKDLDSLGDLFCKAYDRIAATSPPSPTSPPPSSTVHVNDRPLTIAGLRGRQERDDPCDLVRGPIPRHSERLGHPVGGHGLVDAVLPGIRLDAGLQALGGNGAGVDGVDANTVLLATIGEGLGQVFRKAALTGVADAGKSALAVLPPIPAILTIAPRLVTRCGHAARQQRMAPKNFNANPSAQSASGRSRKSPRLVAPALFTSTSICPKRAMVEATTAAGASGTRRSTSCTRLSVAQEAAT